MADERSDNTRDLTANITVAWLANPNVRPNMEDVTSFLENVHAKLVSLSDAGPEGISRTETSAAEQGESSDEFTPAVSVRKSLGSKEHIISLIDGKPYKSLKRHLSGHGLTPAQYRERYGLKADYPMVAPAYAEKRRALAKKIGLGRKPRDAAANRSASASPKTARRKAGRPARAPKATS